MAAGARSTRACAATGLGAEQVEDTPPSEWFREAPSRLAQGPTAVVKAASASGPLAPGTQDKGSVEESRTTSAVGAAATDC